MCVRIWTQVWICIKSFKAGPLLEKERKETGMNEWLDRIHNPAAIPFYFHTDHLHYTDSNLKKRDR